MRRSGSAVRAALRLLAGTVLLAGCVPFAAGQNVVVGTLRARATAAINLSTAPLTIVDLADQATAAGDVTSVTVQWMGGGINPCSPGFKVKFFRLSSTGGTLIFLGERGPFPSLRGLATVAISPPVTLQVRDLIGITEFGGPICGGVGLTTTDTGLNSAQFLEDVTSDKNLSEAGVLSASSLSIQATGGSSEVRTAIVPTVISSPGNFGANFKTAFQATNPGPYTISGRFVFHPQGRSAAPNDPTLSFSIPSNASISSPDIVAAMGQIGVGSLDVLSTSSSPPLVVARVFNDGGLAGTSGFTEAAVAAEDFLRPSDVARIITPADLANFRMNVGVRTLSSGASLTVQVYATSGTLLSTFTKGYSPDFFEQGDLTSFLNGVAPGPNQTVSITVTAGSAIVYAATADNRTNDSSIQIGNRNGI